MSTSTQPGLSSLATLELSPPRAQVLQGLEATLQGDAVWRARKRAELRDLLALEQLAERMTIVALDASTELLAHVRLAMPVPCQGRDGELVVRTEVDLALRYPSSLLRQPLPGHALVRLLRPQGIVHPNVQSGNGQRLCLGANVPRGYPAREAVLACYAALSLQAIGLDPADPAGIMNTAAIEFWSERLERIPLTREPFLSSAAAAPEEPGS